FRVHEGVVYENRLDYTTTLSGGKSVTAHAAVPLEDSCVFDIDPWNSSSAVSSNGIASITPSCSSAEKEADLEINTACLTRLGGCRSIADLVPGIWEYNAEGALRCRIPNHEGWVHSPPSWTWVQ